MRHEKEESGKRFEYIYAPNVIQTRWCIHKIYQNSVEVFKFYAFPFIVQKFQAKKSPKFYYYMTT